MNNDLKLVPMGKLLNLIETAGFNLEYHFDDLVFINNTSLLFRFDVTDFETVYLHFNVDCDSIAKSQLTSYLMEHAEEESLKLELASNFEIKAKEGEEEIQVEFKP